GTGEARFGNHIPAALERRRRKEGGNSKDPAHFETAVPQLWTAISQNRLPAESAKLSSAGSARMERVVAIGNSCLGAQGVTRGGLQFFSIPDLKSSNCPAGILRIYCSHNSGPGGLK